MVYAAAVRLHQHLHQWGILTQKTFVFPIINVGNLSVGGTGKSPHIEYIHQLLKKHYTHIAIISRGYRRKTKGLQILTANSTALDVGDEPLQFKIKYPQTTVAVAEKRATAIDHLLQSNNPPDCILLDDAFQHWGVQVPINILLSTFYAPFFDDQPLPAGRLREFSNGYKRAQIIIITKCPQQLSTQQKEHYINQIQALSHQHIFFSHFEYQALYRLGKPNDLIDCALLKDQSVCLFTAIASTQYLKQFLQEQNCTITSISFSDHHHFSEQNLLALCQQASNKLIITTEKDATKLYPYSNFIAKHQLSIYVLPIKVAFAEEEAQRFEHILLHQLSTIGMQKA